MCVHVWGVYMFVCVHACLIYFRLLYVCINCPISTSSLFRFCLLTELRRCKSAMTGKVLLVFAHIVIATMNKVLHVLILLWLNHLLHTTSHDLSC